MSVRFAIAAVLAHVALPAHVGRMPRVGARVALSPWLPRGRAVAFGGGNVGSSSSSSSSASANGGAHFADLLRDAAPYIAMHRDSAMVIHIPGEAIDRPTEFAAIMDDLALLNLLGVQIVIVVGVRAQIDARLAQLGHSSKFVGATRITDATTMRIVKEVSGFARSEVESALARGLTRISWSAGGFHAASPSTSSAALQRPDSSSAQQPGEAEAASLLNQLDDPTFGKMKRAQRMLADAPKPTSPEPSATTRTIRRGEEPTFMPRPLRGVEVVSSNTLFTARPIGVRGGIDFGYTGEVRKVNRDTIGELLRRDWVVLMTPLGYSASGEVYNCNSHELASETAAQIGASKLIFYTPGPWKIRAAGMASTAAAEAAAVGSPSTGPTSEASSPSARRPAEALAAELGATPERAEAIFNSLSRVQSMRMLEAKAVVDDYRKWQRQTTADELWRIRKAQRAARQLVNGIQPTPPPAGQPSTGSSERQAPSAWGGNAHGERPLLAPLVDAAGRELSVWASALPPVDPSSPAEHSEPNAIAASDRKLHMECSPAAQSYFVILCSWAVRALSKGVRRAHLIDPAGGQVLEELYTSAGTGVLIARDVYEGFREASVGDIPQIMELISPLEEQGILTRRGREVIEAEIERGLFHVLERDGQVLACAILKLIPDVRPETAAVNAQSGEANNAAVANAAAVASAAATRRAEWAEVGCLAVNSKFRNLGRGEAMLGYLQRLALKQGVRYLFCLSTHTMQWFVERGFEEVPLTELPESRIQAYNWKRNSKCFAKELSSSRDLDAQELFWGA